MFCRWRFPSSASTKTAAWLRLSGNLLVTDEVIRRVESGQPFRTAYRSVADELKRDALTPDG